MRIEDYGLIGDTQTAALVGIDGSLDWLCLPRFDSGSCFSRLLGDESHGRWSLGPVEAVTGLVRRYRGRSLVLETEMTTATGTVRLTDFMPPRHYHPRVVRIVECVSGHVELSTALTIRFEYGTAIPWVVQDKRGLHAVSGPNALWLDSPITLQGRDMHSEADFTVLEGEAVTFVLSWHPSFAEDPSVIDPFASLDDTLEYWKVWCSGIADVHGEWQEQAVRSLITLKALTYAPTGGIVAAPTTSLPEALGGVRNWDYRYCWVRDATLTLDALLEAGCVDEARAWINWLVRAAAGAPEQLQIMYGPAGERRLTEFEVDNLPGYEGSAPVRVGNAAADQFQLDVYGELMDALGRARRHGLPAGGVIWDFQLSLMRFVTDHWCDPDDGIWEVRGPRRHFTHSRVMAWVAFDRAVQAVETYGVEGPVEQWRESRDAVRAEVLAEGWSEQRQAFTQYYGSTELDASVLMIPLVGFLPANDHRVVATVEAIQRDLMADGFVLRYQNTSGVDGLPGTEGAFLPCTFWLADCLAAMGRQDEAKALFTKLLKLTNDIGLISEEYDPVTKRLVGNFPQAFTHVGLINTARGITARMTGAAPTGAAANAVPTA